MFNHIKSDQSIQSYIINRRLSRIVPKTYNKTLYFQAASNNKDTNKDK